MIPVRRTRLLQVAALTVAGGLFIALVTTALIDDTGAYLSPSQLLEKPRKEGARLSIGGWVMVDSWRSEELLQQFVLADDGAQISVQYTGLLPDLFAEGEAAVAMGTMDANGVLQAYQVLARHDENYRPPGVAPLKRNYNPSP